MFVEIVRTRRIKGNFFKSLTTNNLRRKKCFKLLFVKYVKWLYKKMLSHSLVESIILPACGKILQTKLRTRDGQEISKIILLNHTVHRHILELSADLEKNVSHEEF